MNISKKASRIILGLTALVSSRTMFALFNDPEGPNLLIVMVLAVILYGVSFAAYSSVHSTTGTKKLLLGILTQIIIVTGLYFLGR